MYTLYIRWGTRVSNLVVWVVLGWVPGCPASVDHTRIGTGHDTPRVYFLPNRRAPWEFRLGSHCRGGGDGRDGNARRAPRHGSRYCARRLHCAGHPLSVVCAVKHGVVGPVSPLTVAADNPLRQVQPAELVLAHAALHVVAPSC